MTAALITTEDLVLSARAAVDHLGMLDAAEKSALLNSLSAALVEHSPELLAANTRDVDIARAEGRSSAIIDRLRLTPSHIMAMAESVVTIARMADPVGSLTKLSRRPNGMLVGKMCVPLGVILMIYEARPNVTVDAAALSLKSGNAVILRGGSEAHYSNAALASIFNLVGFPRGAIQVVTDHDRGIVPRLLADERIDVVIPRGGASLMQMVTEHARMPVLRHGRGVCHLFVDRDADLAMATALVCNAKTQRPSTCNALETLLVDRAVADRWLPDAILILRKAGVEIRGDAETQALSPHVHAASEADWDDEYLDLILAVRVVDGIDEAIAHIRRYGTRLADGIITSNYAHAMRFLHSIDSAAVLVNASTRLVDGTEFGLGAEIGISTQRVGPRGPMGLLELTTSKWVVLGSGQVRR